MISLAHREAREKLRQELLDRRLECELDTQADRRHEAALEVVLDQHHQTAIEADEAAADRRNRQWEQKWCRR